MIEDSDYSASEARRCTENFERVVFRENTKPKRKKCKCFLAFSSILLMVSLSLTLYIHHHEIILSPFRWGLIQLSLFLLFFMLGVAVALVNVRTDNQP